MGRIFNTYLLTALLLLTVSAGYAGTATPETEEPIMVSVIQLIATPERFEEKLIRVVGFCRLESDVEALYVHREDLEAGLTMNSIRLKLEWPLPQKYEALQNVYVIVEGRFSKANPGSIYAGVISEISRLERWPSRAEMTPPREREP